jgi:hypothetical protein
VNPTQIFFGVSLVVVLTGAAGYFIWRQIHTLRGLSQPSDLSDEDRRYVYFQVWRRLAGSALMLVLAILLATSFILEEQADKLVEQGQAAKERREAPKLDPSQVQFVNFYGRYWGIFLIIVLALIVLAGWDCLAIRRYGQRHYRQLQEDRKTMIENELARLRSQRNGHH